MRRIKVVPYDPQWAEEFDQAKAAYALILKDLEVEILHVGSTSVEGLWAKPILDIDIVVDNEEDSKTVIALLERAGYVHRGDLGVPGREAFGYEEGHPFIRWMDHHLYVCMRGCESLTNHLLLQKHLRENKDAVEAYSALKQKLAEEFSENIDAYVEGKTVLINSFLKAEGMDMEALARIEAVNKVEK